MELSQSGIVAHNHVDCSGVEVAHGVDDSESVACLRQVEVADQRLKGFRGDAGQRVFDTGLCHYMESAPLKSSIESTLHRIDLHKKNLRTKRKVLFLQRSLRGYWRSEGLASLKEGS